jgi:hypothetical protein
MIHSIRSCLATRLIGAVEGECDGLAIDEHQAMAILSYVLEWKEQKEYRQAIARPFEDIVDDCLRIWFTTPDPDTVDPAYRVVMTEIVKVVMDIDNARGPPEGALLDVAAERQRQIAKGYDTAHDDTHIAGELINSLWGALERIYAAQDRGMSGDVVGYKRYLIQATAQIVAEVERVCRAEERSRQP